ncbi:uncharacterized protein PV09_04382 [Verruconis gallopava]|uniref:ER-bound oxygenase mpaB/mpaB'/Rubber oxygenase catalytic domain-containing protein n=1 Tax=Verruconis gallopava TaxID=253628 RepID=A0A0D1XPZ4_9PEZI|nr:uncharacterized protein PV09_04382 [Verruconis gallopava]KIW04636.1 hypothetical protein PV09_04382 [Verruconis gallopava]
MACPAGYTEKDLHLLNGVEHYSVNKNDVEKATAAFKQICEPDILRKEIMPEPVMFLASQYSILMQWCKYGLARGSLEHSDFANRVLRRLVNTTRYLNSVVYGTAEDQAHIASVIHRYHAVVKADKDSEGDAYYADDPELHKWTAATLFVAFYDVYEMFFGPMSRPKKTKLMKECAVFGTGLRMPPEMWFETLEEFYAYWNHNVETLEVTHWARELANMLMYPKLPWILAPGSIPFTHYMRVMTIHFLPPRIREGYGFKYGKFKRFEHQIFEPSTKIVVRMTPKPIRHALVKPGVWDMKKAAKRIEKNGKW